MQTAQLQPDKTVVHMSALQTGVQLTRWGWVWHLPVHDLADGAMAATWDPLGCSHISKHLQTLHMHYRSRSRRCWQKGGTGQHSSTSSSSSWMNLQPLRIFSYFFPNPQESIEKLLAEGRHKAPLRYIESIKLEEFTLGLVPPRFHSCHARYNPTKNYLQLEVDMTFQSSGFQCIVSPRGPCNPCHSALCWTLTMQLI